MDRPPHQRLSIVMIVKDGEATLERSLASAQFSDELIVCDTGSSDRSPEIARAFTNHVHNIPFEGFGRTKQAAVDMATGDWVLALDADEWITPQLADDIIRVVSDPILHHNAYAIRRRTRFLGKVVRHSGWGGGRDKVTRLFRRGHGRYTDATVHESIVVDGTVGLLSGILEHDTDRTLESYFEKVERYTTAAAADLFARGRRARWWKRRFSPAFKFVKMYILQLGFLDGRIGWILARNSAHYVRTKYRKLHELHRRAASDPPDRTPQART